MTLIALDREALELIAQQLDSRMIDTTVLSTDLKRLIRSAKPATDPALVASMVAEIKFYGSGCRSPLHKTKQQESEPCQCRRCRILREVGGYEV